MGQTKKLGKTATNVRVENGKTIIRYTDTDVVSFDDSVITLDTGGRFTVTTKARMNQASNQFDLGFLVRQTTGQWFAVVNGKGYQFPSAGVLTVPRMKR
jgi:hypothetical protein